MKIAALYDIHGNLPALNAVLEELNEIHPDLIFIGGDIVSGPMPVEVLKRLAQFDEKISYIRGNGDREVVMSFDKQEIPYLSEKGLEKQRWVAEQLTLPQRNFLAQLPEQFTLHMKGLGDILFCHATPNDDNEIFTPISSKERIANIFHQVDYQLVVCGHTHIQFTYQVGEVRILNAGSEGMLFSDQPAAAYWLLFDSEGYEFRHTLYDKDTAFKEISGSGDPQAQEFIETYILNPITEGKGMEILENLAKNRGK